MKKEEKSVLPEQVADVLRKKIINNELCSNERIIESDFSKLLDVSRGSVRDALKILMYEGLVDYEPNKGCKVSNLSMEDAYEVFYLRGNLESMALEQCGGKLMDIQLFAMQNFLDEMKKAMETNNSLQMVRADELIHREIAVAGKMKHLVTMWESLSPLNGAMFLKVNETFQLRENETKEEIFGDYERTDNYEAHKRILDSLKTGDKQKAIEEVKRHYITVGELIYKIESRRRLYSERSDWK